MTATTGPGAGRALPRLHLITDRAAVPDGSLARAVTAAVSGGVGVVHLREKDLGPLELLKLARDLVAAVRGKALLLVNGAVQVALDAEADGTQLPRDGLAPGAARRVLGAGKLIGCSVHGVEEARTAAAGGADFLLLGTIFETSSKPGRRPAGVELIRAVTEAVGVPVVAIGGINHANVPLVMRAGAYGVAVRSAILEAAAPAEAARRLLHVISAEVA